LPPMNGSDEHPESTHRVTTATVTPPKRLRRESRGDNRTALATTARAAAGHRVLRPGPRLQAGVGRDGAQVGLLSLPDCGGFRVLHDA